MRNGLVLFTEDEAVCSETYAYRLVKIPVHEDWRVPMFTFR
jgi:hypothetical protein